jgi:uncharacterized protein (TIGR02117 family)
MLCIRHIASLSSINLFGNWLHLKLFRINDIWTGLRAIAGWPLLAAGFFMLCAAVGGIVPANRNWVQPSKGITVFVETNGVHVSLIVPMRAAGQDLSDLIRPEHLSDPALYGTHFMIGWGHKAVYRNARTWGDVRSGDLASAVYGSDETTMHVYHLFAPRAGASRKMFRVRPGEYRAIVRQIRESFMTGLDGNATPYPAYGPDNIFYDADGRYSAFNTCNNWTGRVLRNAGIRVGLWTPLPGGVMRWF